MRSLTRNRVRDLRRPRAFTIVEAVISTVIVAVMLVAALSTVGTSRVIQQKTSQVDRGRLLAEALLAEVLQQSYQDPDGDSVFGREADESATARTDFDDVDDYDGWSSSPPIAQDGTILTNATGWTRSVTVLWIDSTNPTMIRTLESGAKKINIVASYNNVPQATLTVVKTAHP